MVVPLRARRNNKYDHGKKGALVIEKWIDYKIKGINFLVGLRLR